MLLPPGVPNPSCHWGLVSTLEVPPPVPAQLLEVHAGDPHTVSFWEFTPALADIPEQLK
jgi:hypothetical protein